MKLKEARSSGIEYCEANNCNYTYIAHDNAQEFYLTENEDRHTVFFINRNGSLHPCRATEYAVSFHKELKKRKKLRKEKLVELITTKTKNKNF